MHCMFRSSFRPVGILVLSFEIEEGREIGKSQSACHPGKTGEDNPHVPFFS